MGRTKREQSTATIQTLVTLARAQFAALGYGGVNLQDLVAEAGLTRGAVYHHFQSKQGLFDAVVVLVQRDIARAVSGAAARFPDPWDQLVAGSHAFVDAASAADARQIVLIDGPAVLGWSRWRELDAEHSGRLLAEVLAQLATEGVLAASRVGASSVMLSGAMNEAALWLARPEVTPVEKASVHATLDRLLWSVREDVAFPPEALTR